MSSLLNSYQIALIAVLVLNFLFWFLVICFRLFFHFAEDGAVIERRRRRPRTRSILGRRRNEVSRNSSNGSLIGVGNPGFLDNDDQRNSSPYNITGGIDAPPSYDDVVKHCYRPREPLPPLYVDSLQRPIPLRRPVIYEQPVVLRVPEEQPVVQRATEQQPVVLRVTEEQPTAPNTSQNHFASTCAAVQVSSPQVTPEEVTASNNSNNHISQFVSQSETDDLSINDYPLTFVIDNIGPQSARIMNSTNTIAKLSDGEELETYSKV